MGIFCNFVIRVLVPKWQKPHSYGIVYCLHFTSFILHYFFPFVAHCEKVAFLRTYELHLLQNAHTTCTCFASFRIFEVGIFKSLKIDRDILKFTSCCFLWWIKCSLLWPQICMNGYLNFYIKHFFLKKREILQKSISFCLIYGLILNFATL